jgi:hypothetical protein
VIFTRVFLEMFLFVFRMASHATDREVTDKGGPKVKEKGDPREGIQWNV